MLSRTTATARINRKSRPSSMFALLHSQVQHSRPTFYNQKELPRLPVPPLRETLRKYLRSLEPFLAYSAGKEGYSVDSARAKRVAWAEDFEHGLGPICQQRLLELDRTAPFNWLDDHFWLKKAYLECRSPLIINSNWWLALQDDEGVPPEVRRSDSAGLNTWQMRRAAWICHRALTFKQLVDREEIPPDTTRGHPLCMSHYQRMFNSTRIPMVGCDNICQTPANHIVLFIQDHLYSIDAYDEHQALLSPGQILGRIQSCVVDAQKRGPASSVSVLTADNRETWAKMRQYLLDLSPQNHSTLEKIDSSLFALSLDCPTLMPLSTPSPQDRRDAHLHNTAYGCMGRNRWFDKTISFSVETNTRLGMTGEHSPCDALIPSILGDFTVGVGMDPAFLSQNPTPDLSGWSYLGWDVDDTTLKACQRVQEEVNLSIQDSDDSVLWFEDYGVDWMKQVAKLSADAYIQMAIQLAFLKDRGHPTAVYETASTRLFLHGRTEVIRSLSKESVAFIEAMAHNHGSPTQRRRLLSEAVKVHNDYTREASSGRGADRHLMGLRLVMKEEEFSPLFEDELYGLSQEWLLSTSGLSAGDRFIGTGFGSPYLDGYGINYLAGANMLKFGIESKRSSQLTSTDRFKRHLTIALLEMRDVCLNAIDEENRSIQSKEEQARL